MNNKMAKNTYLSTIESKKQASYRFLAFWLRSSVVSVLISLKNKLRKQEEQRRNHGYGEHLMVPFGRTWGNG